MMTSSAVRNEADKRIQPVCFILIFSVCSVACGQERHPIHDRLARVPAVWEQGPVDRLTLKEYEATLDLWKTKYKDRLKVERVGESAEGV